MVISERTEEKKHLQEIQKLQAQAKNALLEACEKAKQEEMKVSAFPMPDEKQLDSPEYIEAYRQILLNWLKQTEVKDKIIFKYIQRLSNRLNQIPLDIDLKNVGEYLVGI